MCGRYPCRSIIHSICPYVRPLLYTINVKWQDTKVKVWEGGAQPRVSRLAIRIPCPSLLPRPLLETKQTILEAWPDMDFDEICRRVVPHSRELLETFECHVNVEWAHSVEIINYLYKHIYKHESGL